MHPLKEDTFVLDFVNDREEIFQAFKDYYEGAEVGEEVEPAKLYQMHGELDASALYAEEEVEAFCRVFFLAKRRPSAQDHTRMEAALEPATERFRKLQAEKEDEAEDLRAKIATFRNLYTYLSQIIPFQDTDLEKLYTFLRFLSAKLPKRGAGPSYSFDDEVRLEYYRLQKISEGSISLSQGEAAPLKGPTDVASGMVREKPIEFSRLIDILNDRFGTDFTDADQLYFDQIREAAVQSSDLQQAAQANPLDKFQLLFGGVLRSLVIDRMEQNEELTAKVLNDETFQKLVSGWAQKSTGAFASRRSRRWRINKHHDCTRSCVENPAGSRNTTSLLGDHQAYSCGQALEDGREDAGGVHQLPPRDGREEERQGVRISPRRARCLCREHGANRPHATAAGSPAHGKPCALRVRPEGRGNVIIHGCCGADS